MNTEDIKARVEILMARGVLASPDLIDELDSIDISADDNFAVMNKDIHELMKDNPNESINWLELEKSRVMFEKKKNTKTYTSFLEFLGKKQAISAVPANLSILFSYKEAAKKRDVQDFVSYYNARYSAIEPMLQGRSELRNLTSIGRLKGKKDKETVSVIGMVTEKRKTKKGNIMLKLEDPTGTINVLVSTLKKELAAASQDIVLDEILGMVGTSGDNIVFANGLLWPDIPLTAELKKSPEEEFALFISDLHVGSKKFLPEEFSRFMKWLNGSAGSPMHREIASKVKYLFIMGDLVDGIGIYPDQESELDIRDIYAQYAECARLLSQVPAHIKIVCCPGSHDAVRISEPQPAFSEDLAGPLFSLPNFIAVSNPAIVRIAQTSDFSGLDVLMYHGYSFDYYIANVESIRTKGGYDRADLVMKFLLQRRHLAPSHSSTLYIPDQNKDNLVIDTPPDFFVTGHIHKVAASTYKNITLLSGSCWQAKTAFQEKLGHHPEPARVPVVNLRTREVKILKFSKADG